MYATRSAPQPRKSTEPARQAVLPGLRSTIETAAPLWMVPPAPEGPGMVPSTPTTIVPPWLVEVIDDTRKKFSVLPGCERLANIWLSVLQGSVLSASIVFA